MTVSHNCPEWDGKLNKKQTILFQANVCKLYSNILTSAYASLIDVGDITEWHRMAFCGIPPVEYYAGGIRRDDPNAPCLAMDVCVDGVAGSSYMTAAVDLAAQITTSMNKMAKTELWWSELTPRDRALGVAESLSVLVGGFIRVHPFINGNGRLSRILWTWGLVRFGVPPQCRIHPRPLRPYGEVMAKSMAGDDTLLALIILQYLAENTPETVITPISNTKRLRRK